MDGKYIVSTVIPLNGRSNLYIHTISANTVAIIEISNGESIFRVDNAAVTFTIEGISLKGSFFGAAIALSGTPTVTIKRCTFYGNDMAVSVPSGGRVIVEDSSFLSNEDSAIHISNGYAMITGCKFVENIRSVSGAGAVMSIGTSNITVISSTFVRNKIAQIQVQSGTLILNGNSFFNNATSTSTIVCSNPAGTFNMDSSNLFCGVGANTMTILCSGNYTAAPPLDEHDGCGVCKGTNIDKDCYGKCFPFPSYPVPTCPIPKIIYVAVGGNGTTGNSTNDTLPTIQQGINAASYYGDTVVVMNGKYNIVSPLNFNGKQVYLKTQNGLYDYDNVTIDCGSNYLINAFVVSNGESFDTVIQGFKITNCGAGASISSTPSGFNSAITIRKCVIKNNISPYSGGAALFLSNSFVSLVDSIIENNIASSGGAIYTEALSASYTSVVNIHNNVFTSNSATGSSGFGGAIFGCSRCKVVVSSSYFINNTGTSTPFQGGAIGIATNGRISIVDSSFYGNGQSQPPGTGQSLYCVSSNKIIANTNNYFCGISNDVVCPGWSTNITTIVDNCNICNGNNNTLDCSGECFGNQELDSDFGCCFELDRDCNSSCSLSHT